MYATVLTKLTYTNVLPQLETFQLSWEILVTTPPSTTVYQDNNNQGVLIKEGKTAGLNIKGIVFFSNVAM